MDDLTFAKQVREYYPEGLTGFLGLGSTRLAFALHEYQHPTSKGDYFLKYAEYAIDRICYFLKSFCDLGGQNLITLALNLSNFSRDAKYFEVVEANFDILFSEKMVDFYRENNIDPYYLGIEEAWLKFSSDKSLKKFGEKFLKFQRNWPYKPENRKFIIETTLPILYLMWQRYQKLTDQEWEAINSQLDHFTTLHDLSLFFYQDFIQNVYKINIPPPHFILSSSTRGTLKTHMSHPSAVTSAAYARLFYTPYPVLFMTKQAIRVMIEDMMAPKTPITFRPDYQGAYTEEELKNENERVMKLVNDTHSILGLSRRIGDK